MKKTRKKLTITQKKYVGETSIISTRLPKDIDEINTLTGRIRNEIILKCLEYALKNIEVISE